MRKQGGLRPTSLNSQILDRDNSKSLMDEIERSKSADINQFSVKYFAGSSLFTSFNSISEGSDDSGSDSSKDKDDDKSSGSEERSDESSAGGSGSDEEKQAEEDMKKA